MPPPPPVPAREVLLNTLLPVNVAAVPVPGAGTSALERPPAGAQGGVVRQAAAGEGHRAEVSWVWRQSSCPFLVFGESRALSCWDNG